MCNKIKTLDLAESKKTQVALTDGMYQELAIVVEFGKGFTLCHLSSVALVNNNNN